MSDLDTSLLLPKLADGIRDLGYNRWTPIQEQSLPLTLAGRDMIGCAATGSGKTVAFLLPIFQRLASGGDPSHGVHRALILTPTRELAMQIDEVAFALGYHMGFSAVSIVGGVDMRPQERALKAGAEIIVATPGRLLDHQRFGSLDLSRVEVLVLDEADRMLDMGFLPDLKRIVELVPKQRQTLMFSATMAGPIRRLADEFLTDPAMITIEVQKPNERLVHRVIRCGQARKAALLVTLLKQVKMPSVLVFVNRKSDADRLARTVDRTVPCTSIHSDRSQEQRSAALEAFRKGEVKVLVATDVAARGIDVDGISHVVNLDVPLSTESYIHRGGRTARAGNDGTVITFVAPDEEEKMTSIEREIGRKLPRAVLPGFDAGLDAPSPRRDSGRRTARATGRPMRASRGR